MESLRHMTPEQRLQKAFELSELGKRMLRENLRNLHPELSETDLHQLFLQKLSKCHNRNY
jgi:hypothetical protein